MGGLRVLPAAPSKHEKGRPSGRPFDVNCEAASIVRADAVPDVEVHRLGSEGHQSFRGEPADHCFQGEVFGKSFFEDLFAAEAGGQLEGLAAMFAERAEGAHQKVAVRDRLTEIHRSVPSGEQGQIVLVELGESPGILRLEILLGNLVHPCTQRLSEQLATSLTTDGVGNDMNRISWVYEAKGHVARPSFWWE